MTTAQYIFDGNRVRLHRERAAKDFAAHDFLLREMLERACDRLGDMARRFPLALDIGSRGLLEETLKGRGGVERLVSAVISAQAEIPAFAGMTSLIGFDEELLPFAENSFDLVMAVGSLHWVNDLPGALVQIFRVLKPDGLFIAMVPGGKTLMELRQSFEQAEMAMRGGVSPRVSPFVDVRDGGNLLQRAGFALPVVDSEMLRVSYKHPLKLLHDLRGMGEGNALVESAKGFTPCSLMMGMCDHYLRHYSDEAGQITASFELVTMTGWKPHASQQQPAKRGSGQVNLNEIF